MARTKQSLALGLGLSLWQTMGILLASFGMVLSGWYSLRSDLPDAALLGKNGSVKRFDVQQVGEDGIQVEYTCPAPRSIHISVYHVSGAEMHHIQLNDSETGQVPIPTSDWAPGLYIVQLNTGLDILKRKVRI